MKAYAVPPPSRYWATAQQRDRDTGHDLRLPTSASVRVDIRFEWSRGYGIRTEGSRRGAVSWTFPWWVSVRPPDRRAGLL